MNFRQTRKARAAIGALVSGVLGLSAMWLPASHAHAQSAREEGLCQPVYEALAPDGTHTYVTETARHVELARGCVDRGDRLGLPSLAFTLVSTGQLDAARQLIDSADRRNADAAALKRVECLLLRREKKPEAAVAACEESLRLDPGLALTYITLANAQREAGRPDVAIALLRQGGVAHPRNYLVCSALYEALRDDPRFTANDALPVIQRCHAIHPQLPTNTTSLAWVLRTAQPSRPQEAIEVANRFLAGGRKPFYPAAEYARVYHERGLAHEQLKNVSAALADYTEAIRLDPQSKIYLTERGATYAYVGPDKVNLAIADLEKAIQIDPKYAIAHRYLGVAYMKGNRLAESRAALDAALSQEGERGETWGLSGENHLRLKNYQQAAAHLHKAVQLEPNYSAAWSNLAVAYYNTGQYREALPYFTKALEKDNQNNPSWFWRARAHSALGMWKEAEADYTSLIAVNPGYLWAYRNRADLRMQRGAYAEAHADFTKTADTRPRELNMDWFFWAWSGLESGQSAEPLLQRVERDAPDGDASALWARVLLMAQRAQVSAASELHDSNLDTLAAYRHSSSASAMFARIVQREVASAKGRSSAAADELASYAAASEKLAASEETEERYRNWSPPRFNCPIPSFNLSIEEINRRLQRASRCNRAWREAMGDGDLRAMLGADFDAISPHTLRIVEQKYERAWNEATREIESNKAEIARANAQTERNNTMLVVEETMVRSMRALRPIRSNRPGQRSMPTRPVYVLPGMR